MSLEYFECMELREENAQLKTELEKYKEFFNGIANLTVNHDSFSIADHHFAVVWPKDLGNLLETVDKVWWMKDENDE